MALSSEVIADLKKKCVQAKSKELDFYLFLKAENDEPALVMGLSTDARKEKADIIKTYKAAPAARDRQEGGRRRPAL